MTEFQRLDYSKPPPGYLVHDLNDDGWWWRIDDPEDGCVSPYAAEPEAIASAWAHYKAHNDPPGIEVHGDAFYPNEYPGFLQTDGPDARPDAWAWYDRRLALTECWRFAYESAGDERVLAAVRYQGSDDGMVFDDWWPRCLTWSDDQVAEVERWLVDSTAELPAVLRGSVFCDPNADDPPGTYSPIEGTSAAADDGPHVCTGCIGDGPCVALEAEIEAEERDSDELAEIEAELDAEDEFMDDGLCSPMPQSESGDPTGRDWNRQVEEHNATTLALLNFSDPPPGWIWIGEDHDQGCALVEGASSMLDLLPFPLSRAWESYKLSRDPPGMWCGFSRPVNDLDNCSIRVGVHACGSRWELQPDITAPYDGFVVKAREWAWVWHDRRHALMAKIGKMIADFTGRGPFHEAVGQLLVNKAPFHRVLCWHNEWVDEVEAWIEKPSSTVPEALR